MFVVQIQSQHTKLLSFSVHPDHQFKKSMDKNPIYTKNKNIQFLEKNSKCSSEFYLKKLHQYILVEDFREAGVNEKAHGISAHRDSIVNFY